MRKKVAIAVPSLDGKIVQPLTSWYALAKDSEKDSECPWEMRWLPVLGLRNIPYARNQLVGDFLRTDCDYLWFLDADMVPKMSATNILQSPYDITVSRMFIFFHGNPGKWPVSVRPCMYAFDEEIQEMPHMQLQPDSTKRFITREDGMTGAGTGSMLIARRILEDHRMWLDGKYKHWTNGEERNLYDEIGPEFAPPIFKEEYKPNGKRTIGSDLEFCWRAQKMGYKLAVDMASEVGHHKGVDLDEVAQLSINSFVGGVEYGKQAALQSAVAQKPARP